MVSGEAWSQKNPLKLIEGADDMRLDGKTGRYFVQGNVRLVKDDTKMYCDSAVYNSKKRLVRAFGNVHINKEDTLNLFCDSLYYEIETEFAKLWGNVRVRDNEYKLVTDSLDFYGKENKGVYRRDGVITSIRSDERLTSKVGYFFTDAKNFFFRGDVVYTNEEYKITTDTLKFNGRSKKAFFFGPTNITGPDGLMYCEKGWYYTDGDEGVLQTNAFIDREKEYIAGDSLYYNKKEGLSIGKGNVVIRDTSNQIEFTGDYARSSEKERFAFITGHALAKRFEEEEDTLYIHADTLYNYLDTLNDPKLVLGYRNVKLFKSDMQGVCDSLSYDRKAGTMNMYTEPVLWAKKAQLSSDTITVFEKEGDIRRAFLRMNALTVTEVDTGKYYNQIGGKTLNAYFDSVEIRRIDIEGNAKTVMFLEDEEEKDTVIIVERSGMNRIYASNLSFYMQGGEIKAATYRESPDGRMYPMNQIKKDEEKVDGFKWDNSRRPISWQTMIMTSEEFSKWEAQQQFLKELRELKPLSKVDPFDIEMLTWAKNKMISYSSENLDTLQKLTANAQDSIELVSDQEVILEKVDKIRDYSEQAISVIDSVLFELVASMEDEGKLLKKDSLGYKYTDFKTYKWYSSAVQKEKLNSFLLGSTIDSKLSKAEKLIENHNLFKKKASNLLESFEEQQAKAMEIEKKKEALQKVLKSQVSSNDTISQDSLLNVTSDTIKEQPEDKIGNSGRLAKKDSPEADSINALIDSLPTIKFSTEQLLAKKIVSFLSTPDSLEINLTDSSKVMEHYEKALFYNKDLQSVICTIETLKLEVLNVERKLLLYFFKSLSKDDSKREHSDSATMKDNNKSTEGQ